MTIPSLPLVLLGHRLFCFRYAGKLLRDIEFSNLLGREAAKPVNAPLLRPDREWPYPFQQQL